LFCPECRGEFREGFTVCPDCEIELVTEDPSPETALDSEAEIEGRGEGVVVLRTGVLFEADMAAAALENAGVPYYRREESSGGLSFAMPAAPSPGPGTWWRIEVPAAVVDRAEEILNGLPMPRKESPGVWDFRPPPEAKGFWKSYAGAMLLLFALVMLMALVQVLRELIGGG
jgi:hypothetical protein